MKARTYIAQILIALFTVAFHIPQKGSADDPPLKVRLRLSAHETKAGAPITLIEYHEIPKDYHLTGRKYKLELVRFTSSRTGEAVYLDDTELRHIPYTGFFKHFPSFERGSGPFILDCSGKHGCRTERTLEPLIPGWYLISGSYEYTAPDGSKELVLANNSCLLVVSSDDRLQVSKGMQSQLQALEDAVTIRTGDSADGIP